MTKKHDNETAGPCCASSELLADCERRMNEAREVWRESHIMAFTRKERHKSQGLWVRFQNRKREYETALSANAKFRSDVSAGQRNEGSNL